MNPHEKKVIRRWSRVVNLIVLGLVVFAFTVDVWIGVAVVVACVFLGKFISIGMLSLFYGPDRVEEAVWGDSVLEPPEAERAPGLPDHLLGRTGRTATDLAPMGEVSIDGSRYPARTNGKPLGVRTDVVVIGIRLGALIVKANRNGVCHPDRPSTNQRIQRKERPSG